jgi:hypothetical protein
MKTNVQPDSPALTPDQEALVKAVSLWVNHLARTLKTCRLYDGTNPTVIKFRQDLAAGTQQLLEQHGSIALAFTADDVLCEETSVYEAKSRDDNLAFPFYRDGIRTITLAPGLEPRELDGLLDAILLVTGHNVENDDLVTLLWERHLPHVDVDYVPGEPDMGGGGPADGEAGVPWPTAAAEAAPSAESDGTASADVSPQSAGNPARSDDWCVGEFTIEIEAGFEELQSIASEEVGRFMAEYQAERDAPLVASAIAVVRAYLSAGTGPGDRAEIARFLPGVLRQAFAQGSWDEAIDLFAMMDEIGGPEWSKDTLGQELMQPISIAGIRERLEQQEPEAIEPFVRFTGVLGEPGTDLMTLVLPEIQSPRHQKVLSEAIAERCRHNPERLAPGLADPRWTVVRNIVQILGVIGGAPVVGMLRAVSGHPEPRVRLEVVQALRRVEGRHARPLLTEMLEGADARMFSAILHQLSQERDPATAQLLLAMVLDSEFEARAPEEKRAIYAALSLTAGDEAIPELEAELHKGNWFTRIQETHRQAVARCIARIGTPHAREVLEGGARSRRAAVRKACEDALQGFGQ